MARKLTDRVSDYMEGRNGSDDLTRAVLVCAFAVVIAGIILGLFVPYVMPVASWVAVALLAYAWFRVSSTKLADRARENGRWLAFAEKFVFLKGSQAPHEAEGEAGQGGTDAPEAGVKLVFHCPTCGQSLRMPKGKGVVRITCPRCHSVFKANS